MGDAEVLAGQAVEVFAVDRLARGASVALVSDAGTPLVSDPGSLLVAAAATAGVTVVAVPGPCAAIAALSIAGLPTGRFAFEGFLPAKSSARKRALEALARETRTQTAAALGFVFGLGWFGVGAACVIVCGHGLVRLISRKRRNGQ